MPGSVSTLKSSIWLSHRERMRGAHVDAYYNTGSQTELQIETPGECKIIVVYRVPPSLFPPLSPHSPPPPPFLQFQAFWFNCSGVQAGILKIFSGESNEQQNLRTSESKVQDMIQYRSDGCSHEKTSHGQTSEMQFIDRNSSLVGTLVISARKM